MGGNMKALLSARTLLSISIALLCINLLVMLVRTPPPAYAQDKKAKVECEFQMFSDNHTSSDRLVAKLNKAGETGWRAKGMAIFNGTVFALMEKEK
jgi:hypothetical protein